VRQPRHANPGLFGNRDHTGVDQSLEDDALTVQDWSA
jgi:hypothetical protein